MMGSTLHRRTTELSDCEVGACSGQYGVKVCQWKVVSEAVGIICLE